MNHDESRRDLAPIGVVVDALRGTYPDVSHSSLRFLERERLVVPTRTPGGHRLYAPSDIERVRQIKTWQAQRVSLADIRGRLARLDQLLALGASRALAELFLQRLLAGDLPSARRAVLDAHEAGLALEVLFDEVLRPALWELGGRWARGAVTVAQEKEGTELAQELITELVTQRLAGAVPRAGESVVAACVAGEQHELGLRMVGGVLRARQIAVHFLGANVAADFLLEAVRRRQPSAVLLSATLDEQLPTLRDTVTALRDAELGPPVWAGGQAVERHAELVAGWGVAAAIDGVAGLDTLVNALRAGDGT